MSDPIALVAELRGFAEGSTSARASLMRDAADAIEKLSKGSARPNPTQANLVLGVFFEEMDKRDWSTSVSEVTTAQQATIEYFRWSTEQQNRVEEAPK